MLNICSLFQKFFGYIKSINKKMYRTSAVIMAGTFVISVVCLGTKDFGGSGKNSTSAGEKESITAEEETEKDDTDANALIPDSLFGLTDDEENNSLGGKIYYVAETINAYCENVFINKMAAAVIPMGRNILSAVYGQNDNGRLSVKENGNELVFANQEMAMDSESTTAQDTTQATDVQTQSQQVQPETQQVQPETQQVQPETQQIQPETQQIQTETQPQQVQQDTTQQAAVPYNAVNIDVSEADYYWLTKIVEAEAGNQDDIGKILVVNVIINRVKSGTFPGSIKSVIFQNNGKVYQFEPVKNGRIYDMNPTENTINCVNRALNGEDYSQGALYFTMKTSSRSWFNTSLTLLFVHGDHYFYTN